MKKGSKHSEEAIKKIKLATSKPRPWKIGFKHSEETKRKISYSKKGQKLSKETREKMSKSRSREKHHNWKGGNIIDKRGYIYCHNSKHTFYNKSRYVKRSRLIVEQHLKRYLTSEEVVHHKGIHYPTRSIENRQDDSLENLQAFSNNSAHIRFHRSPESVKPSEIIFDGRKL